MKGKSTGRSVNRDREKKKKKKSEKVWGKMKCKSDAE